MTGTPDKQAATETDWGKVAGFLFVAALTLVGVGFYTMFTYQSWGDEGPGRLVSGDAYNYIIIATRGVGWMVAGVVVGLMGVGAMLARPQQ